MTTLTLEINPQKESEIMSALRLIEGIQKIIPAEKNEPAWLIEAREMKKHPERYRTYSDLDEMFADLNK